MKGQCTGLKFHWVIVISMVFHFLFLLLPISMDRINTIPPLKIELGSTCEKIGPSTKLDPPSPPRLAAIPRKIHVKAFHLDTDIEQHHLSTNTYPKKTLEIPDEIAIAAASRATSPVAVDVPELPYMPPHPDPGARPGSPVSRDGLKNYLSKVRKIIEAHKRYPLRARRLGIEGEVMVAFKIDRHGNAIDIRVLRKSPFYTFNKFAVKTISSSSPFPPPPERLHPPLRLAIRIDYQLER